MNGLVMKKFYIIIHFYWNNYLLNKLYLKLIFKIKIENEIIFMY